MSAASDRDPGLAWRRPAPLWALLALTIALGVPALVLMGEDGMGQLTLIVAALSNTAALLSLMFATAIGRMPRSRREVMLHVLWLGVFAALASPLAFQILLTAMEGVEAPEGPIGLSSFLPFALTPLSLFVGLPIALLGGLCLAFLAFRRAPAEAPVMTLTEPAREADAFAQF